MEDKEVSMTALTSAFVRAYHVMNGTPKMFNDFLAYDLLTQEERTKMEQNLPELLKVFDPERAASCPDQATALAWVIRDFLNASTLLVRARYTEDSLETAVKHGVKQYVILGAGMDTFAFRQPELIQQLQVFEIDHPVTQGFKRNRLMELGWQMPAQLHFIPLDFKKDSLVEALDRSSYNRHIPSFFSWLGVTYYLTREVVFATLRDIVNFSSSGSIIIFDYLDSEAFIPGKMAKNIQVMQMIGQQLSEPLKAGFDPATIGPELEILGLRLLENLSPSDIEERYFRRRTDGYHANEHFHLARAMVI
ncbi:leucine carboxyl methyltransferase [Moorella thermoacetica]|uniref:S-adenosyl-L-methionine-dependent methyltransferase n=1 Tax=Neomoorella thermoacetica TaxID=1525 RepID=A0A1J5NHL7_NEOTH|nr:leucine carboxyl methyltransferase [Moorella thermoacetica]